MSKRSSKHVADDYESDGGFVEDAPRSKKQKKDLTSGAQKDDEGNEYWELSGKRRIQISEFKGKTMVNIREFYEKDGKALPGKKGISLSIEQYETFIGLLPEIEGALKAKGISVPRPQYGASAKTKRVDENDGEEVEESSERPGKRSKPNHEATSDEDEE